MLANGSTIARAAVGCSNQSWAIAACSVHTAPSLAHRCRRPERTIKGPLVAGRNSYRRPSSGGASGFFMKAASFSAAANLNPAALIALSDTFSSGV